MEAGALVRNAVNAGLPPARDDDRTPGQRRADRLVELCQPRVVVGSADGAGPRPHLIIRTTVDTLIGAAGSPGAELDGVIIPAETVRRIACDAAISRIIGKGLREIGQRCACSNGEKDGAQDDDNRAEQNDRIPNWVDAPD